MIIAGVPMVVIFGILWLAGAYFHWGGWTIWWAICTIASLVGVAVFSTLIGIGVTTSAELLVVLGGAIRDLFGVLMDALRRAG